MNFHQDDFHSYRWLYVVLLMFKKTWFAAIMALSGGSLNAVLAMAANFSNCILLVLLMPLRSYQAHIRECLS